MITDAFFFTRLNQYDGPGMTDASIALIAGGDIRASAKVGQLTELDLETVLPFENHLVVVKVPGKVLLQVLEHAVARYSDIVGRGEFLQMSGIHVTYDMSKEPQNRVASVSVMCSDCKIPSYKPLDFNKEYGIIVTSFVHEGGDGYTMFEVSASLQRSFHSTFIHNQLFFFFILQGFEAENMNTTVIAAVETYIENEKIIHPIIEGRITVHNLKLQNENMFYF